MKSLGPCSQVGSSWLVFDREVIVLGKWIERFRKRGRDQGREVAESAVSPDDQAVDEEEASSADPGQPEQADVAAQQTPVDGQAATAKRGGMFARLRAGLQKSAAALPIELQL